MCVLHAAGMLLAHVSAACGCRATGPAAVVRLPVKSAVASTAASMAALHPLQVWAAWGVDLAAAAAGALSPALLPPSTAASHTQSGSPLLPGDSSSGSGQQDGGSYGGSRKLAALAAAAPACPQLCLYSQADVLIPPPDVRRFAAAQVCGAACCW